MRQPDARDIPNPQQHYNRWVTATPVATRGLLFLLLFLSFLHLLLPNSLTCVPYFTLFKVELWRLFTANWVANGFFSAMFMAMTLNYTAAKLERALGSLHFLLLTLLISTGITTLFVLACATLAYNPVKTYRPAMLWAGNGVWGTIVALSVVESRIYPHPTRRLFMLPWKIPSKHYPLALLGLLCFFGFSLFLPIGYAVGHVITHESIPPETLQSFQMNGNDHGFVGVSAAMGGQAYGPMDRENSTSGSPATVVPHARGAESSMESGSLGGSGRGQVLGSGRSGSTGTATNEVPSARDELLPSSDDPAEAAALAAERRMAARSK